VLAKTAVCVNVSALLCRILFAYGVIAIKFIHGSYGHGKSWNFSKSWKVMENGESHGKVMEF